MKINVNCCCFCSLFTITFAPIFLSFVVVIPVLSCDYSLQDYFFADWDLKLQQTMVEMFPLKSADAAYNKIGGMLASLGDPFTRIISPKVSFSLCMMLSL